METNRILLRPWRDSDAETLFKWASDPDVGPRAGWAPHQSVEQTNQSVEIGNKMLKANKYVTYLNHNKSFTYSELLALSLQQSDNNACDILFERCGGPNTVDNISPPSSQSRISDVAKQLLE